MDTLKRAVFILGMMSCIEGYAFAADESDATSPTAGLTRAQARGLFDTCQTAAGATDSAFRTGKTTKMWCAVVDREGLLLLIRATDTGGRPTDPSGSDAWRGSIEIAIAKAYTAVAFSSDDQALDSKTVGLAARTDAGGNPAAVGTNAGPGPLFGIGDTNPYRPLTGNLAVDDQSRRHHHGIVTFAGGQPVYSNPGEQQGCVSGGGVLLGAVGVSGDGVDQDDSVAIAAVQGAGFCTRP